MWWDRVQAWETEKDKTRNLDQQQFAWVSVCLFCELEILTWDHPAVSTLLFSLDFKCVCVFGVTCLVYVYKTSWGHHLEPFCYRPLTGWWVSYTLTNRSNTRHSFKSNLKRKRTLSCLTFPSTDNLPTFFFLYHWVWLKRKNMEQKYSVEASSLPVGSMTYYCFLCNRIHPAVQSTRV